jgi:hypothetical protein
MDKFFVPTDKTKFIRWLLQTAVDNGWTIVLEYSGDNTYDYLKTIGTEVSRPITSRHNYDSEFKLTAIINPVVNDESIDQIMTQTHVMSVYNRTELILLIADDFDEDCFSATTKFYDNYRQLLHDKDLLET